MLCSCYILRNLPLTSIWQWRDKLGKVTYALQFFKLIIFLRTKLFKTFVHRDYLTSSVYLVNFTAKG